MKRILAATDFSECSLAALRAAKGLCKVFGATLRVVYVDPETFAHLLPMEAEAPRRLRDEELSRTLRDLVDRQLGQDADNSAPIETVVRAGPASEQILQEAERWNAQLIVVGTHGRTAFGRLMLGSVSTQLLHTASEPLLIVPETAAPRPGKILAAVDGGPATSLVLRTADVWQLAFDARLTVAHVMDSFPEPVLLRLYPDADLKPEIKRQMDEIQGRVEASISEVFPIELRPKIEFLTGPPALEICRLAQEDRSDLLIIGAHQKRSWKHPGNTAARIAHHSPCAVLVARLEPWPDEEDANPDAPA